MELTGNVAGMLKLLGSGSEVEVTPILLVGTKIAEIKVDGTTYDIFAPSGGSGGSSVEVTPTLLTGTKIAEIEVDGVTKSLYAPTPGSVDFTQIQATGTKIATININGNSTDIYAPSPTSVSITQVETSGTKIATITVNGDSTDLFAPSGGGGGGGGSYTITPLSNVGTQDIGTLTLNDSILNYDIIMVECCRDTTPAQRGNIWLPTAIIDQSSSYRRYRAICPSGSQNIDSCFDFYFQNNNQIVKSYSNAAFFYSCYGIKF